LLLLQLLLLLLLQLLLHDACKGLSSLRWIPQWVGDQAIWQLHGVELIHTSTRRQHVPCA
jgi:hypothetical protein